MFQCMNLRLLVQELCRDSNCNVTEGNADIKRSNFDESLRLSGKDYHQNHKPQQPFFSIMDISYLSKIV